MITKQNANVRNICNVLSRSDLNTKQKNTIV